MECSLVAPVSGVVMEINSELETDPRKVNSDPYGQGWMIKVRLNSPEDADGLMMQQLMRNGWKSRSVVKWKMRWYYERRPAPARH